ncbi:hypothetical protein U1Q18_027322 [Sarracenia purpurea var. burkii]
MDVAMLLLLMLARVAMGLLAAASLLLFSIDTVQPSLCYYVPMPDVLLCSYTCRAAQPMAAMLMCYYDPIPTVLHMPVMPPMLNPCLLSYSTEAFSVLFAAMLLCMLRIQIFLCL